jgi:hypothetical protein
MLCAVDKSTGFNWTDGRWEQVTFVRKSYMISTHELSEFDGACDVAAISATHDKVDWTSSKDLPERILRPACYDISTVGEKGSTGTDFCELHSFKNGAAEIVKCDVGGLQPFTAQPGGAFAISSAYGGFDTKTHDSVHISIGSCSDISD